MTTTHSHDTIVSVPALTAAAALVGFALTITAAVKIGWINREAIPTIERSQASVPPVSQRSLSFADGPDGSVLITDAASGATIATIATDSKQGGFIRGVLRGLARERRLNGVGAAPPFRLTRWQDGSLSLVDEGTGRSIELGGFGPDNSAAFAALLAKGHPR